MTAAHEDAIEAHYRERWGAPAARTRWEAGPNGVLPRRFEVLIFRREHVGLVFATVAMSQPGDEEAIELHMLAREDMRSYADVVEILTVVARRHRSGQRLGVGDSVSLGRPWLSGSTCTHGLVSLPYLEGPALEWLESPRVRCLWLIPVTQAEVAFKEEHGVEALESKLEDERFDYLDPSRDSVI